MPEVSQPELRSWRRVLLEVSRKNLVKLEVGSWEFVLAQHIGCFDLSLGNILMWEPPCCLRNTIKGLLVIWSESFSENLKYFAYCENLPLSLV